MSPGTDRIASVFSRLKASGEKALIPFVTAGDPSLEDLPAILRCLTDAGADLIEVGFPFSDPIADGSTIQASSQRSLDRGVTPPAILKLLAKTEGIAPVVVMGYMNTALRRGLGVFARELKDAGVVGTILSDLTPESAQPWISASHENGLANIFLVAPTSTPERIQKVVDCCSGFVYAVSRTGVTGVGSSLGDAAVGLVGQVRQVCQLPVVVGFGISSPDDVSSVCGYADGAVVGSSLVAKLAAEWDSGRGAAEIHRYISDLKARTR